MQINNVKRHQVYLPVIIYPSATYMMGPPGTEDGSKTAVGIAVAHRECSSWQRMVVALRCTATLLLLYT